MRLSKDIKSLGKARVRPSRDTSQRKVYSYYASGSGSEADAATGNNKSSAGKRLPSGLVRSLKLLPGIMATTVIIGSILYSLTISSRPTVAVLQDMSSPYRNIQEYADTVDKILSNNTWGRTKFTVQAYEIEQMLLDNYPELQDATLRLPVLGRQPQLVVDIRQPALLLSDSVGTYVIDKNGIAVSPAGAIGAEDKRGLSVIRDNNTSVIEVGKQVLTRETVHFVAEVIHQLIAKDYQVSSLILPVSINELDIRLDELRYYIKTDTSGDARLQIGSFISTERHLKQQGIVPTEYIDVRVEEKVFYK